MVRRPSSSDGLRIDSPAFNIDSSLITPPHSPKERVRELFSTSLRRLRYPSSPKNPSLPPSPCSTPPTLYIQLPALPPPSPRSKLLPVTPLDDFEEDWRTIYREDLDKELDRGCPSPARPAFWGLEPVAEGLQLELDPAAAQVKLDMEALAFTGRRPSPVPAASSSPTELRKTTEAPASKRRPRGSELGCITPHATSVRTSVTEEARAYFDLSTRLLCESLGLDFVAIVALPLGATSSSSPHQLLSHHDLPILSPFFDIAAHNALFDPSHCSSALLYAGPQLSPASNEFSTGLLVKIGASSSPCWGGQEYGFILTGYSVDEGRELTVEDLHFFKQMAAELSTRFANL